MNVQDLKTGYLVEFSRKHGLFEPIGPSEKALVSKDYLIQMFQSKAHYVIWNCSYMDVGQYQANHKEKLPEYGF